MLVDVWLHGLSFGTRNPSLQFAIVLLMKVMKLTPLIFIPRKKSRNQFIKPLLIIHSGDLILIGCYDSVYLWDFKVCPF